MSRYSAETEGAFSWIDYTLFGAFLCISLCVGIYHAWRAWQNRKIRHQLSNASKLLYQGDGEMPIVPIALSLLTTFLSGVTMLGTPAEIYRRGLHFWLYYLMGSAAFAVSGLFFLPIFYKLQAISVYEYFERRFESKLLRLFASLLFEINSCFYMAVVLYSPATALAKVTKIADGADWPWILVIGIVCVIYTSIGGLKAVVWTDTIQAFFMYLGVGIMIVKGVLDSGMTRLWQITDEKHRWDSLKNVDPNPFQYTNVWISIFGAFAFWMSLYGLNQMALQRYCSLPSLKSARIVVYITVPAFIVLGSMACFIGLVMLAYFYDDCDPLMRPGDDKVKPDQLVILFAVKMLKIIPGLPGLFLACLFSATLSTFSSGMNSQAAVLWEDFLKPHLGHRLNDSQVSTLNKILVVGFGTIATMLAFLAPLMGGIIQASFNIMGGISGPLIGLFFLGVFIPTTHKWPSLVALIVGCIFCLPLTIASVITKPYAEYNIPANITYCYENGTAISTMYDLDYDVKYGNPDVFYLFRISAYIVPFLGILVVMLVGTALSLCWKDKEMTEEVYKRRRYWTVWAKKDDNPDEEVAPGLSYEMQQQALHTNKIFDAQENAKPPKKASFF